MRAEQVRVLLCIPTLTGGGAERQIRLLAPRLVERGIRPALFSRLGAEDRASLAAAGVHCFPIAARRNHDPRLLAELARAARGSGARIVHTWLTQMDVIGGAVALATRRNWILSERWSPEGYGGRVKDRLRARLGRLADMVVANSSSGLAAWSDHPRRTVIDNGVDFAALDAVAPAVLPGVTDRRPLLVTAARLAPNKRIEAALHALPRLRRDFPEVMLAVLGTGPEERALKKLVARLGVQDNVWFAGFRSDAWAWIKAASIFVSPSRFEGQPNAVLEAAALGTPQILSDIVMHRDTVGEGGALFADPADPDAFAAAIAALIRGPALAEAVAASARSTVERLSIARAADRYAALYRAAASGRPGFGAGRGAV